AHMVNSQIKLSDAVKVILRDHQEGLSPQQIRDIIKQKYPFLYNTESNQRNVDKGHYNSLDHALLASIYTLSKSSPSINVDKSVKPMVLTLEDGENSIVDSGDDIENEDIERLESGVGTLYILGTNTYTKGGEEIVKIGITTGSVDSRINQLYTTGVPFKFRLIKQYSTT
ncbi:GIY-YIG nuclease family protein, partial [Acidithiobacillus ferridurans]|uniref:GIY-YIG nuclease family protein n=1 Tax=Acidithiobacillus ferridurans TaxID=1232575 RepID=UPI001C077960